MVFEKQGNALCIRRQAEQLLIEPWGKNAFRLRGTKSFAFTGNTWALTEPLSEEDRQAVIQTQGDESAEIANGRLTIRSNGAGVLTFLRTANRSCGNISGIISVRKAKKAVL